MIPGAHIAPRRVQVVALAAIAAHGRPEQDREDCECERSYKTP